MGNNISSNHRLHFNLISDKYNASYYLNEAEKKDFYLEECYDDRANSIARHNLSYSPNSISLRDVNYASIFTENIISYLPIRLLNDLKKVNIIQLMPTADGGMPHTRPGNIICYPDIIQFYSKTTLIHELWHIHQRNYKDLWSKTFETLGWTVWNGQLPEHLENTRRYNPDTIDSPFWVFNNEWLPIPIFKNISKPHIAEVDIWFYNIKHNYHIKRVPESILLQYPNLPSTAYEHPREITAYMLSEPDKYKDYDGFKQLIQSIGAISIMIHQNIS
jgi:hypothetical protein